jgi:hypothetical protein
MRLPRPFIRLPFSFDHQRLAREIGQFSEEEWRPHPQRFEGNANLVLVSSRGEENDDFAGPMVPSERLQRTPYLRQVMGCFDTVIGRSRLMRLAPGAEVSEHTDGHYFWRNHLRIHVPILTEPSVIFRCGDEQIHMAAGEAWTFDNWQPHSVQNGSQRERVHLVIDTVGSAGLWGWIEGDPPPPKYIDFVESEAPRLRFEGWHGLPVMPPAELRADLEALVEDIDVADPERARLQTWLRRRTADFVHDWASQWMEQGPNVEGFAGFKGLRDALQREIDGLPDGIVLASNRYAFKTAITYTLDATLNPSNFTAPAADRSAQAPAQRPRFDRPVFIVAAPRSGSTLLFETLAVNRELWSLGDESHRHFERIASLRPSGQNPSNRLTAEQATPEVVDTLLDGFVQDLVNSSGTRFDQLSPLSRPAELRFLEKTPKNALRIPFLLKAFPDARFIFLFRDARQNISSLLDSWRSGRYVTYPQLPGWPAGTPWSHLLIPGWQDLRGASLAEIAATQWRVTNEIVLADLRQLPPERWCAVDYDRFLADTHAELQRLCHFAQIIFGPRMHEVASQPLKPSKYTLTAPHPEKWKKNAAELDPVLPSTEPLMAELRGLLSR